MEFLTATIAILIDGLMYSSWIFLVAVGLSLIFGVLGILNIAHGGLYAFGAYVAAWGVGKYFDPEFSSFLPPFGSFAVLLLAAIAVGVVLGLVLERGLLRFMYGRDEVIIVLVTFAAFLMLEDGIMFVFGVDPYFAFQPYALLGNVKILGISYAIYELSLIPLSLVVCALMWWGLTRTIWGKLLQAVIHDREIAQAFGINVSRVFTVTFVLGAILGAMGGAFTAPMVSVTPGMGVEVIVLAFAVVAIGGMGSIPGAAVGALLVGIIRAAAVHLLPVLELFIIYGVMALVLAFRPQGLFGQAEARKI
ncbi:MAG: branched-chain amino acid ABC transporter permease [SAR324 cluster bacterium]|nr:branched-chain amino acid ABC transporter permease [SAR324 cluster bacterium]MCH8886541.1 branched-chain amino acid ABC transporter permease [SAR324 cluster bacterium]